VALDVESAAEARELVERLGSHVNFYKVGMELYAATGMDVVRELLAQGKEVFLDPKFYDIPETVRRAVAQVAKTGVRFLTVHGSASIMRAAVEGRGSSNLKLLAVTVLTSFGPARAQSGGVRHRRAGVVAARSRGRAADSGTADDSGDSGGAFGGRREGRPEAGGYARGGGPRWGKLCGDRAADHARSGSGEGSGAGVRGNRGGVG
jgi:orotidine-5'-phosphate decarboxylase